MSNRRGIGGRPPIGGGGMGNVAQQLQRMQQDMIKAQEELSHETLEISAGGGAVQIAITGHQRIQSIILKPEAVDPEDIELLQDMLVAAVNQAIEQSQAMAAQRLESLTGGMSIPNCLVSRKAIATWPIYS